MITDFQKAFPATTAAPFDDLTLAHQLLNSISILIDQLVRSEADTRSQCQSLADAGACNGKPYWRNDGKKPILYANHPIGAACPLHGEPKTRRGRIRYYIGTDPAAQQAAIQHIANAKALTTLESILAEQRRALRRVSYALEEAESFLTRVL